MSIRSSQTMKKILWLNFFINKQRPFFEPFFFYKPHCHGRGAHLNQGVRVDSSLVCLDSCKKTGDKSNSLKEMVNGA